MYFMQGTIHLFIVSRTTLYDITSISSEITHKIYK
jgi:hypothetical protein